MELLVAEIRPVHVLRLVGDLQERFLIKTWC